MWFDNNNISYDSDDDDDYSEFHRNRTKGHGLCDYLMEGEEYRRENFLQVLFLTIALLTYAYNFMEVKLIAT